MRQQRTIARLLLIMLLLPPSLPQVYAGVPLLLAASKLSAVRDFGEQLASWVVGRVSSELSRRALAAQGQQAVAGLRQATQELNLPPTEAQQLRRILQEYEAYAFLLQRTDLNARQVRSMLLDYKRDFQTHVSQINAQLEQFEARLSRVERRLDVQAGDIAQLQREQEQTHGRLSRVEEGLGQADSRISQVEQGLGETQARTRRLEETVYPDPDRWLRHETFLSFNFLYTHSPELGNGGSLGTEIGLQYNFNQHIGAFGALVVTSIDASDVRGMPTGSAVSWSSLNLQAGPALNLLPPSSPVSLQLGAGVGVAGNRLSYYAPGVDRSDVEAAKELGRSSSAYGLLKAEVGIAPPAGVFEPVASFTYMTFLSDIAYQDGLIQSNVGRTLWSVCLGFRLRLYMRAQQGAQ